MLLKGRGIRKKCKKYSNSNRKCTETVPLSTNPDILDPIQKALREGNFMTKEGIKE